MELTCTRMKEGTYLRTYFVTAMRVACLTGMFAFLAGLAAADLTFMSIGDWGGANLNDYHKTDQYAVAASLAKSAAVAQAKFVIGTGDNFY